MDHSPWLASLRDTLDFCRERLLVGARALSEADLARQPVPSIMSPREQLLHVAWAEANWRGRCVGKPGTPRWPAPTAAHTLPALLDLLAAERAVTLVWFETLTDAELLRPVQDAAGRELSVVWVLHHLARHDAHHAGQILALWRLGHDGEPIRSGYSAIVDTQRAG
ncbi:MAG: DinB family protein [Fimbriimonadaceae bacterium]|nr:DinB family protein [Fimbriimonadaceae bacterium]